MYEKQESGSGFDKNRNIEVVNVLFKNSVALLQPV